MPEATIESRVEGLEERIGQISKDIIGEVDGLSERIESLETVATSDEESFRIVHTKIDQIEALIKASLKPTESKHDKLYAALAMAQGEIQAAEANKEAEIRKKDDYNVVLYTFKYADLAACLEVIRKPLADNELCLIQIPSLGENNAVHMRTVLGHSSGQTISCEMTMYPEKGGPQAIGTCMAYLRRYSLCSLIGVAQFDDDAASATKGPDDYDRISTAEVETIIMWADENLGERADEVVARMLKGVFGGIDVVGDIRSGEAEIALTNLQNAADLIEKKAKAAKAKEKAAKKAAGEEK